MVYFPIRKCYHAIKVTVLLILVIAVLGLFERWRGGKRGSTAFSDPDEAEFENQILEDEARIVPGLGEGGIAAYLTGRDKKMGEESEKRLAMNVYLSDRIAYNRSLKDHRNPACSRMLYDAELPSASVILIFHNEPYSVVIRTVWSVINSCRRDNVWFREANFVDANGDKMKLGYPGQKQSSPLVYLKEIILVDDNSTLAELKGKLSHYVRTRLPPDLIRILRLPDRVGLTRARLAGARYAVGDVLVFLDSHCEPQPDWLRPLLHAVKKDPHAVVVPIIDVIDSSTFYYSVQDPATFQVGGFTFTGHFNWIDVPEREKKRRGSDIAPTWSPTMAGGLFAINRAYYWELGAYDEQMAGWGGENLEMSFRIWQCGGTLETIPCSRVGHVFRSFHPYGLPAHSDTHGINTARMAEVWMDEYAELFYLYRPDLRKNPKIGDVTHRKILRDKLQCKSFQWYLDNIYKEKFVPIRDAYGYGRIMNPNTGLCLDTLQKEGDESPLGVYQCHKELQATQYFVLSLNNELRGEDDCAHVMYRRHNSQENDDQSRQVVMSPCHGKQREQKWVYKHQSQQIQHSETGLCLDAGSAPGRDVLLRPCTASRAQIWTIDYSEENDFMRPNEAIPTDQQKRLHRLRGQKRKSRSLLSFSDTNAINSTVRRHSHKKHKKKSKKYKKVKNKFILKLIRKQPNNTEEDHLEVDIHCKHLRLYPNNSFVRDLVTILNEKDIKIINNGRVFERNKVSLLDPREGGEGGATRQDPPHLPELQTTKKSHNRKPHAPPPPEAPPSPPSGPSARAHRIIIEDFVQLTPTTRANQRMRKRRRKHPPVPPTPPRAPPLARDVTYHVPNHNPQQVEEQLNTPIQSHERAKDTSVEDTPMISGSDRNEEYRARQTDTDVGDRGRENDGSDVAEWTLDEPRFRGNNSSNVGGSRRYHAREENDESISDAERPVHVVMRSNMTFRLPDTFFDTKRARDSGFPVNLSIPPAREHSVDDVADTKPDVKPDVTIDVNDLTDGKKESKESDSNSDSSSVDK